MTIWRRIVVGIIVGLLAPCVYWSLIWSLPASGLPIFFAGGLSAHPNEIFQQVAASINDDNAVIAPDIIEAARRSERHNPFATSFMLATGYTALQDGNFAEAEQLLGIAVKRNPRSLLSNAALADARMNLGRSGEAATQFVTLLGIAPRSREAILPRLFDLLQNPSTRDAAVEAMANSPAIRNDLALRAARAGLSPEVIMALQNQSNPSPLDERERSRIGALVAPYVDTGDIDAAIQLSEYFYGEKSSNADLVTDGQFTGTPGPPFGWDIMLRQGVAFNPQAKGLWLNLTSRQPAKLAAQILTLGPGRYVFDYALEGKSTKRTDLSWKIDCIASGQQVLDLPFDRDEFFDNARTNHFSIPASQCGAQRLSLITRRSSDLATRNITISEVSIQSLDDSGR
ncbi:MAG: tetratricopeptide repeat protein [Erythrobacter sp.]